MDTARYVEKIATLFGKVVASMEPEDLGLTPSQLQGLSYLYHHGESPVGEIAQGLTISHPAAVRMVDRLRKKGFVRRTESKSDRRVSLIGLTEAGHELGTHILAKRTEILARALARVKPEDLEGVMRGIEALLAAMLEDRKSVDSVCLRCGDDHIGCCIVNRTHLELTGTTIDNT
ncbi:MAG: MarR family transcriptional regulator [Armatimonadota bacterium]